MANTHVQPDHAAEINAIHADLLTPAALASNWAVPVPPSMTLAPFDTYAYVSAGSPARLTYVYQAPVSLALTGGDGLYWIAIHYDTFTPVSGWTRRIGSHYLWRAAGTRPADPPGALVVLSLTVASGVITTGDGTVAFPATKLAVGGPRGQLTYATGLTWSASLLKVVGNVEANTHQVLDTPGDGHLAFYTTLNAAGGTGRWALLTTGDAPARLGGTLQVVGGTTLSTLQVNSTLTVAGLATLGASLNVTGNVYATGQVRAVGSLYCDGFTNLQGAVVLATTLQVTGALTCITTATCTDLGVNRAPTAGFRAAIGGSLYVEQLLGIGTLTPQYALDTPGGVHAGQIATAPLTPGQWGYDLGGTSLYAHGKLGIATGATALSFNLHVNGTAGKPGGGPWSDSSARHWKTRIAPIANALGRLLAQCGRQYEWTEPVHAAALPGTQYGFIHDEVTLPQWRDRSLDGSDILTLRGFEALCIESLRTIVERLEALEKTA
jgi:hypothetical protein